VFKVRNDIESTTSVSGEKRKTKSTLDGTGMLQSGLVLREIFCDQLKTEKMADDRP